MRPPRSGDEVSPPALGRLDSGMNEEQRGRLRDHLNYIASRAHAAVAQLDSGNLPFVAEALADIGAKQRVTVGILDAQDPLASELARSLEEVWLFAWVWACQQGRDRGGVIHRQHAEMLARVHAAFVKAHAAGLLEGVPTSRLPELLAEQGYDIEALATLPVTSTGEDRP